MITEPVDITVKLLLITVKSLVITIDSTVVKCHIND